MMVTDDVGPFRVTGLRPAVTTLKRIMGEVKQSHPAVHDALGSMGMLCCRNVRGSSSSISNHSWGTAVDMTLEGKLDRRGDARTQRGLLDIYEIFNRHKFFWGAAFPTEDSMHFEASEQLVREWAEAGEFGTTRPREVDSLLDMGDRGAEVETLQTRLNLALGLDLATDGIFGPNTRTAVMEFQRENGLAVDGVVGPNTQAELDKLAVG